MVNADFHAKFDLSGVTKIFTDASKDDEQPIGWAFHVPEEKVDKKGSLDKRASIFTGEAVAISSALDWVLLDLDRKYCLFSDSRSVLMALTSAKINGNPYITVIKNKFAKIKKISTLEEPIKFVWIPSHRRIDGNEPVDIMAKEASLLSEKLGRIPYSDFTAIWSREAREKTFQLNIQEGGFKGVFYFHNYLNLKSKPWFHKLRLNRWEIVTINRLRANHYSAAASLHRKNITPSSECATAVSRIKMRIIYCGSAVITK